ncbi:MAG: hypothetical protein KDJ88_17650 [Bauldia sp.]|nr:hypothetical protein [Bauldia sp.]
MTETLTALLLRRSEAGDPAPLSGFLARPHFGPAFDRLLTAGVIEEIEPADSWPTCVGCDCGLDARPIEPANDGFIAVCPSAAGDDMALEQADRRTFLVHGRLLVAYLAGRRDPPTEVQHNLWHLGFRVRDREVFATLCRSVVANASVVDVVRWRAGGKACLVAPPPAGDIASRLETAGIAVIPPAQAITIDDAGRARFDESEMARLVRSGPIRLEVRSSDRVVHIDGTRQHVPERPFELLLLFMQASRTGSPSVASRDFEMSKQRKTSDVLRELKKALTRGRANAAEIDGWFAWRGSLGRYELLLDPDRISFLE